MAGPIIYADSGDKIGKKAAIDWVLSYGLTRDEVAIVQRDGQTLVIAKCDVRDKIYDKR